MFYHAVPKFLDRELVNEGAILSRRRGKRQAKIAKIQRTACTGRAQDFHRAEKRPNGQ